jgi:hypothetical protein
MIEQEFEDGFKKHIELLKDRGTELIPDYSDKQVKDLIIFITKFKSLYKKEFFAG